MILSRHRAALFAGMFVAAVAASVGRCDTPRQRTLQFTYSVEVKSIPHDAGEVRLWVPLPVTDAYQTIRKLSIRSQGVTRLSSEPVYGNHMVCVTTDGGKLKNGVLPLELSFEVTRREHRIPVSGKIPPQASSAAVKISPRFLQPDRLVPLNGEIRQIASRLSANHASPMDKAHAVYEYVLRHMVYDKSGTGWGRGDVEYACRTGRGNCTDFHSLFIALTRAMGIPAKFEIGFPLPPEHGSGVISGYHCWAEFYVKGIGWVPVDASEASRHPDKAVYFFGSHDENRIQFTTGRDLVLSPPQQGAPLNYFIYPYVEIDGKPYRNVVTKLRFRDVE